MTDVDGEDEAGVRLALARAEVFGYAAEDLCPIHEQPLRRVCGELGCARCYEADLLREPLPRMRQVAETEEYYDSSKHRVRVRRRRGPRP